MVANWKNGNGFTIDGYDVIVIFLCCFVSLVKFSFWSKFQSNIITGSGVITNSSFKGMSRNPEIGNTPEIPLFRGKLGKGGGEREEGG